jgi:hypothetical protein
MSAQPKRIRWNRLVIFFLAWVVLPVWVNFGTAKVSNWYDDLQKDYFHGNPYALPLIWCVLGVFLFAAVVVANTSGGDDAVAEDERSRLLAGLLERYATRRAKKMDEQEGFAIELQLKYSREGTSDGYVADHYDRKIKIGSVQDNEKLYADFEQRIKRLMILGEPGSGKTVLLLEFAVQATQKAQLDTSYPLPVLLNLASWRSSYGRFESWLEENLTFSGGVGASRKYARELIAGNHMFLMLDGLDEVPAEDRESCLAELRAFLRTSLPRKNRSRPYPQVVICSRLNEYIALEEDAYVRASLRISPFDRAALKKKLEAVAGDGADILLKRLGQSPDLADHLRTAFNVHLALRVAEERGEVDFRAPAMLLDYSLSELRVVKGFALKKKYRYLHYLAFILSKTKKVVAFELSDMQPFWATESTLDQGYTLHRANLFNKRWNYFLMLEGIRAAVLFFIFLLVAVLVAYSEKTAEKEMWIPVVVAFAGAAVFGLFFGLTNLVYRSYEISVRESRHFNPSEFNWRVFFVGFRRVVVKVFTPILIASVIGGMIAAFNEGNFRGFDHLWDGLKVAGAYAWEHRENDMSGEVLPHWVSYFFLIGAALVIVYLLVKDKAAIAKPHGEIENPRKRRWAVRVDHVFNFSWVMLYISWIKFYAFGLIYGFYLGPYDRQIFDVGVSIFGALLLGLPVALIAGTYAGMSAALFTARRTVQVYRPYRRLLNALLFDYFKFAVPFTFFGLLLCWLVKLGDPKTVTTSLQLPAVLGVVQLFAFFMAFYNSALIKHLAVRCLLFLQGKAPLRYRRFLDEVARTGLMERDGGEWRFRHQLIQNLFEGL